MPKVAILWDIPRHHQNSMDRYANRLSNHLQSNVKDRDWNFNNLIPRRIRLPIPFTNMKYDKVNHVKDIIERFIIYPVNAFFTHADLYHIIDHGYGHLAYGLPNRRLVITCNDLMTLRIAEGAIPGVSIPRSSVKKFRWIVAGLQRADAIIAISCSTKKDIVNFLNIPEEKIHVIYMGVDEQFKQLQECEEMLRLRDLVSLPEDCKVIMHVSGVTPYKNIEGVLRTLALLVRNFDSNVHLLRVGGLLQDEHWRLAKQLRIESNIHEAGHLGDQDLVIAYNLADVFLFPSWWEGFGLPPLEAMACGTPVVVSDRASLPEVVGDAGVITAPTDYMGMATAIRKIFEEDEWRQLLTTRGLAQSTKFTWDQTALKTFCLYQQIFAQNR